MKIERPQIDARNCLNFSQVKKSPSLQGEHLKPLLDGLDGKPVGEALESVSKVSLERTFRSRSSAACRDRWGIAAATATGGAVWMALTAQPLGAAALGLAATAAACLGFHQHSQAKKYEGLAQQADETHQAMIEAADDYAATLVSEGPRSDQYTDRRYFTNDLIRQVATVHSRESGETLRTQIELGGPNPRRLEANIAQNTVAVRSAQGDQTFDGHLELKGSSFEIFTHGRAAYTEGPISQIICPDGSSHIHTYQAKNICVGFSTETAAATGKPFKESIIVWDNGQLGRMDHGRLFVASPVVPFQDLTPMPVMPEGVIPEPVWEDSPRRTYETALPTSLGIGTFNSVEDPKFTVRTLETPFGPGFTVTGDRKLGTTRATAADGTTLDIQGSLIDNPGSYRLQTQHPLGVLEQSLLPGEVLMHLKDGDRTVVLQHKSGEPPAANEHREEDFLSAGNPLPIRLDDQGVYQIKERDGSTTDIKPLMPLDFLERKA
ncbi:hypothetical protein JST97_35395 [bacterium]|nr:hypothetical protein [bacterium]